MRQVPGPSCPSAGARAVLRWASACGVVLFPLSVAAQTPSPNPGAPATPAPAPAAPPAGFWIDGVHFSAQIDAGLMGNPEGPADGLNFGHLYDDHANQVQLNQVLLTANKPLDPKNPDFQWGFKLQLMYGSDARYTQYLGELNRVDPDARNQLAVVEANALLHLPWVGAGGTDLKIGQYPSPLGYESIDPSQNPFYSHSYISNFGVPSGHTGVLAQTHVSGVLDIYAGVDTGTNTTFGPLGDNNSAEAILYGVGLNLLGGNLTVVATSHDGPEQATRLLSPLGVNADGQWRWYNDLIITWKASDALTFVTEGNLVRDDYGTSGKPVNGLGVAQYASYTLTDTITLNGRAEYWRDDHNFFVASYSTNNGLIQSEEGFPAPGIHVAPGTNTTYSELTFGVSWKPALPAPVMGLLIRPEIRWDHAYTNNHPFNAQTDNNAFTIGVDAVLTF